MFTGCGIIDTLCWAKQNLLIKDKNKIEKILITIKNNLITIYYLIFI